MGTRTRQKKERYQDHPNSRNYDTVAQRLVLGLQSTKRRELTINITIMQKAYHPSTESFKRRSRSRSRHRENSPHRRISGKRRSRSRSREQDKIQRRHFRRDDDKRQNHPYKFSNVDRDHEKYKE